MAARYWCHMCSLMVNPNIDAEIKCPICRSGFVEEMGGEINGGSISSLTEGQGLEIDFGTDRALSLWAPILLEMMNNPRRRRRFRRTESSVDNVEANVVANVDVNNNNVDSHHHHRRRHPHRRQGREIDLDRELESILRRRRRSSATMSQLLQGIRAGIVSEYENSNPARKEDVENLPIVKISESLQCTVCLDEFEQGSEAKEMPCKHKFHSRCIVQWLELHCSCPVCRYELPPDGETKVDSVRPRTRTRTPDIIISNENEEDDARNNNVSERRFSFPWPFSGLFSSSSSSSASGSGSSHLGENS